MPVLSTVASLATIISTIYPHVLSSCNFCDPGNRLSFAQSPGFVIPYLVSSLTTTQRGTTQFETHMAQVQMTTPGSSGTRTISQAICRTKVWLMPQWYPVPSLCLPPSPAKGDGDILGKGRTAVWRAQEKFCSPDNLFGHKEIIPLPASPGKRHHP